MSRYNLRRGDAWNVRNTLDKTQVARAARLLKAKNRKLPKLDWCVDLQGGRFASDPYWNPQRSNPIVICRDARGYYGHGWWDSPERRAAFEGHGKGKCKTVTVRGRKWRACASKGRH